MPGQTVPTGSAPAAHRRRGSSLVEVLLTVGIIGIALNVGIPMYRRYQVSNDLSLVQAQTEQALARARVLSEAGRQDSPWGFYAPAGILYKGAQFAGHDPTFDEFYPVPDTVGVTGLLDVSFSRLTGEPSAPGTVVITSLFGEQRTIVIGVGHSTTVALDDTFTICHQPGGDRWTLTVPDSAWPAHLAHGDTLGPCTGEDPSASGQGGSSQTSSAADGHGPGHQESSSSIGVYAYDVVFDNFSDAASADVRITPDRRTNADGAVTLLLTPGCVAANSQITCKGLTPASGRYKVAFTMMATTAPAADAAVVARVAYNGITDKRYPDSQNLLVYGTATGATVTGGSGSSASDASASHSAPSAPSGGASASACSCSSAPGNGGSGPCACAPLVE